MRVIKEQGSGVMRSVDGAAILVTPPDDVPDNVTVPAGVAGPRRIAKVRDSVIAPCPSPSCDRPAVLHLFLEGGLAVAECPCRGFLWYRRKDD